MPSFVEQMFQFTVQLYHRFRRFTFAGDKTPYLVASLWDQYRGKVQRPFYQRLQHWPYNVRKDSFQWFPRSTYLVFHRSSWFHCLFFHLHISHLRASLFRVPLSFLSTCCDDACNTIFLAMPNPWCHLSTSFVSVTCVCFKCTFVTSLYSTPWVSS